MNNDNDPQIEKKDDEPNWLKLSRSLDEQYEKSRKVPLQLTREEILKQMEARYGPRIPIKKE